MKSLEVNSITLALHLWADLKMKRRMDTMLFCAGTWKRYFLRHRQVSDDTIPFLSFSFPILPFHYYHFHTFNPFLLLNFLLFIILSPSLRPFPRLQLGGPGDNVLPENSNAFSLLLPCCGIWSFAMSCLLFPSFSSFFSSLTWKPG